MMRRKIMIGLLLLAPLFLAVFLPSTALAAGTISLSPSSGMSGISITVSGGGFNWLCSGYVWFDSNNNGIRDAGEPSKSVTTMFGNIPSGTTLTVPAGIAGGAYQVRADIPSGGSVEASSSFTVISPIISASAGANGSISPSGNISVSYGGNQSFNITANTCYHVASVLVDNASVGAVTSYSFTNVTANHSISANFAINSYTLTYNAGSGGSINGTTPQTVNCNASGTAVTAVPNTCYHFVSWSDASTANPRTDTNVTSNKTVTANFAINTYTLTYNAGAHGSILGDASQTVNCGSSGTEVTAEADECYHFVSWSDGMTTASRKDSETTDVTATFAIDTFTIEVTQNDNGTISPDTTTLNCGASQSFNITAGDGYYIADVLVDGASVGAVSSYGFNNVTANHTISASFAQTVPYWDVNGDHICDIRDVSRIGAPGVWMTSGATGWIPEDVNKDGQINILDVQVLGQHWLWEW